MNKDRRNQLSKLQDRISVFRDYLDEHVSESQDLFAQLEGIQGEVESLKDEEQECLDGLPENMAGGDKAQEYETAVSELDEACNKLGEILDALSFEASPEILDEAYENIENAKGQ